MEWLSTVTAREWALWAFTVYGIANAAYHVLNWIDRIVFGRPRIIRRRIPGAGYVWTRGRIGDGLTPGYGSMRRTVFWPTRHRNEPVLEVDAADLFRREAAENEAAEFFRSGAGVAPAFFRRAVEEERPALRLFFGMVRKTDTPELPGGALFELPSPDRDGGCDNDE